MVSKQQENEGKGMHATDQAQRENQGMFRDKEVAVKGSMGFMGQL